MLPYVYIMLCYSTPRAVVADEVVALPAHVARVFGRDGVAALLLNMMIHTIIRIIMNGIINTVMSIIGHYHCEASGRIKKPNRTGRTEPNRTVSFWNRPEPDAETN